MENKLVTIIAPVYNVAAYLDECLESLTNQTYQDLEILVVDDGSTDGSGEICDAWAAGDNRVRVIHKKNGGAASARNTGMDAAKGEYICFVDSDDTVEPEYVQTLVETLGDGDMAVCGFFFLSRKEDRACTLDTLPGEYGRQEFMLRFLKDWSCSLLWNKLYRKEAIGRIRMAEGHRVDDEYFTYQVALNCGKVSVTDRGLYHYRLRGSSVMQDMDAVLERVMLDRIGYVTQRYAQVAAALPGVKGAYFADAADTLNRYWTHCLGMPRAQKELRRWVNRHVRQLLGMGKQGLAYLWNFYGCKPRIRGEANPIQMEAEEYFP